jgi:hypothetical protein
MGGAWSHRVVRDKNDKLRFACVRFRPMETSISGATGIWNEANDLDGLRQLAQELLDACDLAIIDLASGIDPDDEDDDDFGDVDDE